MCCAFTQSHDAVIFEKNTNSYYYFRLNLSAFLKELRPLKSPDSNQYYYLWVRLNKKSFCEDCTFFTANLKLYSNILLIIKHKNSVMCRAVFNEDVWPA